MDPIVHPSRTEKNQAKHNMKRVLSKVKQIEKQCSGIKFNSNFLESLIFCRVFAFLCLLSNRNFANILARKRNFVIKCLFSGIPGDTLLFKN